MKTKNLNLAKTILTVNKKTGARRVQLDFSNCTSKTRPEFTRESEINLLVNKGIIANTHPLNYLDLTQTPSFEEAFSVVQYAKDAFHQLPSDIRKLIDNDPSKLQSFVNDPSNRPILEQHNVLKKVVEQAKPIQDPPTAAHSTEETDT